MIYHMALYPIMEMMRKDLDGTVVGNITAQLDEQAIAILPMMTILADLENPLLNHP